MSFKIKILSATAMAAALGLAAPAHAFTTEQVPANADGSAHFVDPDEQTQNLFGVSADQDSQQGPLRWNDNGNAPGGGINLEPRSTGDDFFDSPSRDTERRWR